MRGLLLPSVAFIVGWTSPVLAEAQTPASENPALVVFVAVDQLRPDYLTRFRDHFVEGGFSRFLQDGAWFTQARYLHAMTSTCPGHAVMMSGTHAASNGIIANEWWNLDAGRTEYCARDDDAPVLGLDLEGRSPKNLIGSTVGDELHLATGGESRIYTVSGKDRAAIMLGGHLADAAYFLEDTLVVSSAYYMDALPDWVQGFNASGHFTAYFGETWNRILPESVYAVVGPDDEPGERLKPGFDRSFPHLVDGAEATPGDDFVEALEYSPFHNDLVLAFAKEIVRNEGLGDDRIPDILGIGLSANDRIGHAFGPDSHEVMDVTLRTDRLLADLFEFLDEEVGLDRILIVLTSDHGVAPLPEVLQRTNPRVGAGRLSIETVHSVAASAMETAFGPAPVGGWFAFVDRPYVYLNPAALDAREIPVQSAEAVVAAALEEVPGVAQVWTRSHLRELQRAGGESAVLHSFHPDRSGHVMYNTDPWVVHQDEAEGTTHGSPWAYDQQVPILWYGVGIQRGTYSGAAYVSDIAPTLSKLLGIARPSGAQGRVLTEALR